MLALYMTWLTRTGATSEILREAILANVLVNMKRKEDSWFEIDHLNELLNLRLKTIMKFRRFSTEYPNDLFVRTALMSEYLSILKVPIELLAEMTDAGEEDAANQDEEIEAAAEDLVDAEDREGIAALVHGDDGDRAFLLDTALPGE
ncbi:hypothetical protein KEM56_005055 [Ascosphaera pollenicola]|nr:hypothetical protein KEM56_005055 [Ascosphaera pollenicola]